MTIHDRIFVYKAAYKKHRRDIMIGGLMLLLTTLGFALGYGAGKDAHRTPIIITPCASETI